MSSEHLRVGTFHLAIIASVAILLFMLGAYGPESCQPLVGRGSHQHGDAGHPSCKLTVFTSQDVAAPLVAALPRHHGRQCLRGDFAQKS
jgi:hypothetical protein